MGLVPISNAKAGKFSKSDVSFWTALVLSALTFLRISKKHESPRLASDDIILERLRINTARGMALHKDSSEA